MQRQYLIVIFSILLLLVNTSGVAMVSMDSGAEASHDRAVMTEETSCHGDETAQLEPQNCCDANCLGDCTIGSSIAPVAFLNLPIPTPSDSRKTPVVLISDVTPDTPYRPPIIC